MTLRALRRNKLRTKQELDKKVANELGVDPKEVRDITTAFIELLRQHLLDMYDVTIDGLGSFKPVMTTKPKTFVSKGMKKTVTATRQLRVHFSKSQVFKRMQRAKYGRSTEK